MGRERDDYILLVICTALCQDWVKVDCICMRLCILGHHGTIEIGFIIITTDLHN